MSYYCDLNIRTLFTRRYNHLFLLLFWPIHGILFYLLERVIPLQFHPVECAVDKYIPFCEYFIIPYYAWYVYMIGVLVILLLEDVEEFRSYMTFIIVSYTFTLLIYLIYPTSQHLRPASFDTQNLFTDMVQNLYRVDTNTNVCPSLHVIGMMAASFAGWRIKVRHTVAWRAMWIVSAVAVCASTVLLKQHSFVDVAAGMLVSVGAYYFVYIFLPRMPQKRDPERAAV